jgi:hypothetical protein
MSPTPRAKPTTAAPESPREVTKILPAWDDSESWRVTERVWDVARRLTQLRRESLLWGAPVRDADYNLLRFIELPDLVIDDKWDDYGIRPATHLRGDHAVADHGQA